MADPFGPGLIDAIKGFEGYSSTPYWDYGQYTSGWGTRSKPGEIVDKETHEQRLRDEMTQAAQIVDNRTPGLPQGVRDAMISLTMNSGDKWARSGLGEKLREGDYEGAKSLFVQYNKAGGKPLPGLINRRNTEVGWFDSTNIPDNTFAKQQDPNMARRDPRYDPNNLELGQDAYDPYTLNANPGSVLQAQQAAAAAAPQTPRAQEPPGLLSSLAGQQQQAQGASGIGGLLGSLNPEKMAYLAMIAKGLNPYTDVDPTKMLALAQSQRENALKLAQQQREHEADRALRQQQIDINTRRQAFEETQANVTPAAKAAADFGFTKDSGKGPGTPEYQDFMKSFYQLKGEGYKAVDIKDPSTGEARTVFQKGDQFFTPDQLGLGAPASGGNPYSASGKMTADEGKSALYADRAATAHANITKYENLNNQPGGTVGGLIQQNLPAGVANVLVSGERGSSIDAQRAFINALLRRESGAAIAKSEFDSYGREYFPQLGDTPAQIEDKRKHRAEVIAGLAREAGRGYRPGYSFDEAGNIATGKPSYTGKSGGGASSPQTPSERKTINGKGYSKIGGQWYED